MEDGVIKFNIKKWEEDRLNIDISDIERVRERLFNLKLIGHNKELNLGYGNISKRIKEKEFIISGSQTGHLEHLDKNHYTIITDVDFNTNSVICKGPIKPSSESLTHAAFYYNSNKYNGVIHIHNLKLWEKLIENNYISTPEDATYGSIKLWESIIDILNNNKSKDSIIIVMKGHIEGIIVGSILLDLAFKEILEIYNRWILE